MSVTPQRIAVACFPTLGGSGIVASEIGARLAARGHQVRFFAAEPPARLDLDAPRVSFQRVGARARPPLDSDVYPLALGAALADAVNEGFDVIHAHYAFPHAAGALLARAMVLRAGAAPPRVVLTLHGTDVTELGADPALSDVVRHIAATSDALSAPSYWLRDRAVEQLGLPADTIHVIPNFVDPVAFQPQSGDLRELFPALSGWDDEQRRPRVLLHGSSFRSWKRVGDAVRALALVRKQREAVLVLLGDGPERGAVQTLIAQLGLDAYVRYLGPLARLSHVLARADLFVLPSASESFGLAALEALASGVPVVASAVGGLPEVVRDGITGLLVPPGQPEAIAAAALSLLNDRTRHRAMSQAARADALARFAPDPAIDRYEHLLCARAAGLR
jgi:N-acetyl-alpha-D-glucosaminyl L-malate synthase BshA